MTLLLDSTLVSKMILINYQVNMISCKLVCLLSILMLSSTYFICIVEILREMTKVIWLHHGRWQKNAWTRQYQYVHLGKNTKILAWQYSKSSAWVYFMFPCSVSSDSLINMNFLSRLFLKTPYWLRLC